MTHARLSEGVFIKLAAWMGCDMMKGGVGC